MNTPNTFPTHPLTRRAYWHLLWETYAPVLALGILCTGLYFTGAMFGLWQRIGDPWRLIALFMTFGFLTHSFLKAKSPLKPTLSKARRRVEDDNNFNHRPFDTVHDTLAIGSNNDVWLDHLSHAKNLLRGAKPSSLRPALAPIDKYYLRFLMPALLMLSAMVGVGDNFERLRTSLAPHWVSGISADTAHYEAWIDPPEYTGRPPSYFKQGNTISAPEGSEFVARISGVKTAPRLILKMGDRTRKITPIRLGPKSFEARAVVNVPTLAQFRIGSQTKTWVLNIGNDLPPTIKFDAPPKAGKYDKLIFTYSLTDDYGVENLSLALHLKQGPIDILETISVGLPGASVRKAETEPSSLDMTKHKWAGKIVLGHLIATDGKGQIGISEAHEFIVPDKIFVKPLAKAVAEQRLLMLAGTDEYIPLPPRVAMTIDDFANKPLFAVDTPERTILRAPKSVQRVAQLIEIVTDTPSGIFDDPSVYMGMRNIYRRLHTAKDQKELIGIPEDLWAIALRAEFGLLGDALEDMRAAERALNNAMARRAPQREVDVLFDRYNAAVDRYMEALMLEAVKNAKNQDQDGQGGSGDFESDEIQKLLDAIKEANRLGDTVAARRALAQLAQLLENMQIQLNAGGGGSNGPSDGGMSEELKQALEELNDVLGEQRKLRDETQSSARAESDKDRQGQDGKDSSGPNKNETKSADTLAKDQQGLRELLDTLEEQTLSGGGDEDENGDKLLSGDVKKALEDAKIAMENAQDALGDGQYYRAGREQSKAIDALRKAGEGLYAQEGKRLENDAKSADRDGNQPDPFGRENDGSGVGDGAEVPMINDQERDRELLEQLRNRAGDQKRDLIERDYLERLLKQF